MNQHQNEGLLNTLYTLVFLIDFLNIPLGKKTNVSIYFHLT